MSEPTAPAAADALSADDDLPRRVLRLGPAPRPAAGTGSASPHWIAASVHQPGRDSLVRAAQEQGAQALLLIPDDAAVGGDAGLGLAAGQSSTSGSPGSTGAALDGWLDALEAAALALPVVCVAPGGTAAQRRRAAGLGIQVWLASMPDPDALHWQLGWAVALDERQAALRAQLDDRKWTERAKGLLMSARELDEDSAFRLLREAAMHAHLRLGEVARSVVHSAQLAEAVNLAGQQRMLSQRLVKLMAQRAAGIEPKRAKTLQDESCARVTANLARLPGLLSAQAGQMAPGPDLEGILEAWRRLEPLLVGKPSVEALVAADDAAQDLLGRSDALATALAASGAGKPLQVVNLCGRQRMLSQQLAKEALLADLLPGRDPGVLLDSLDRFAAGLAALEASPLSSDAIRALLAEVSAEWLRLMRSLRDAHGREAAGGLARSSEVLLDRLDLLTGHYQQSLQIILG